ncbi:Holliday junction ATP-dependent DNA helicase RuvA [Arenicella chitinivorans]|uniref:Holliday junction branch migration complex subunit RuvA n=1 Tax=Arenicella chitinivorans TaxID=1329800 RepID=A0A918RV98_9GAMM|nr:Holliday junction branch migration protein RuvA [Arenicella chitinivorans]GHA11903.1 Holliday junction ATP-dependent DNA helicase RuvA [Arenicella chitinivorans]
MIAWLQGQLIEKQAPEVVLNVQGVGYELEAPMSTFYDLPDVGETVTLFVHMVVREDAQLLFGFSKRQQREMFRSLIKVNGVGPKVALAVLSTLSAQELVLAMANDDVTQLCKVPGIGKKTAQRLLVEMKDRLAKEFGDISVSGDTGAPATSQRHDAIAALVSLGYKNTDASRVVKALPDDLSSEEYIRRALRDLSGNILQN